MKPKAIMRSDQLPQHLQTELTSLESALVRKYGAAAHMVGVMMENLANVCNMVSADMTPEQRILAAENSKAACADVLRALGHSLLVDPDKAVAVARAYRDMAGRMEEEICGTEATLQATADDAMAAINKARLH